MSSDSGWPPPGLTAVRRDARHRGLAGRSAAGGYRGQVGDLAVDERRAYEVAVIVIPPRAFCSSVTRTLSGGRSSASATSSLILTASASQKWPSFRNPLRYSLSDFDSMQKPCGQNSIVATYRSG